MTHVNVYILHLGMDKLWHFTLRWPDIDGHGWICLRNNLHSFREMSNDITTIHPDIIYYIYRSYRYSYHLSGHAVSKFVSKFFFWVIFFLGSPERITSRVKNLRAVHHQRRSTPAIQRLLAAQPKSPECLTQDDARQWQKIPNQSKSRINIFMNMDSKINIYIYIYLIYSICIHVLFIVD